VQVVPIKPKLKLPGTKRLKLECDEPPSKFAFKINLRRYIVVDGKTYYKYELLTPFAESGLHNLAGAYTRPLFSST